MKLRNKTLERLLTGESLHSPGNANILDRLILALPLKDRCLLRLLYRRGALWWEVAGAMGISISTLRRRIRQTLRRTEEPAYLAMLQSWERLGVGERRLLYLHRVLGLSLREIVRQGLAASAEGAASASSVTTLRRRVRQIEEKAARLARQIHRLPPPDEEPPEPPELSEDDEDLALTPSGRAQA